MVDPDFCDDKAGLIVAHNLIADPDRTHCRLLCCQNCGRTPFRITCRLPQAHYIHCYAPSRLYLEDDADVELDTRSGCCSQTHFSIQSQIMCPQRMCASWMRAVSFEAIERVISAMEATVPPPSPVNATVNAPARFALLKAAHTFLLEPEVEMPTSTSHLLHSASVCRWK